jgi:hypothetical protein
VYADAVDEHGVDGLFRVEVTASHGTGKLKMAGGLSGATRESVNRAFGYLSSRKSDLGLSREIDTNDLHVEAIDLLNNRVEGEIGIASLRAGDIVGTHTVLFAGTGERLTVGHEATDRAVFASGAVRAAFWLAAQKPGRYTMAHVLGLKTTG